jgi:flagellar basal-body rod protein FlgB
MDPVNVFKLAEVHNSWLASRQVAVASNVANADTPGYGAIDVVPFTETLRKQASSMLRTDARHLKTGHVAGGGTDAPVQQSVVWEVKESGNSVSIEQELLKAQEIRKSYSLNTSIMRSFQRMVLAATKG